MSIAKNTTFMTLASIMQKVVAFVYFTIIARYIGVEETGKYFFALSFTTVFVIFIDLGFTNVLIRELSRVKEKIQEYFSTVLAFKMILGVFVYIVCVSLVHFLGYEPEVANLVYLSAITMLFDTLHLTVYGTMRSLGNLKYEAIGIVGSQTLTLILGTTFLFFHFSLIWLIAAFTIPSFCNLLYASFVLSKKFHISFLPRFSKKTFLHLGKIAIPFALSAIFARLYSYMDTLLLKEFAGNMAVGWYSIPYKITFAFQFIPLALLAAMYPKFSEYFIHDKKKLALIFEQSIKYLLIVAFPIAIGIALLAPDIILTVYTDEYKNSILPLQILIVSLIFSYVSFPLSSFLNACNRQVTQTYIIGTVTLINIILNLILIPKFGATGAAFAALIGNFLLALLGFIFVQKVIALSKNFLLFNGGKILLSTACMGGVVWFTNQHMHFLFSIITGVIVYPLCLFATKTINMQQIKNTILMIRR